MQRQTITSIAVSIAITFTFIAALVFLNVSFFAASQAQKPNPTPTPKPSATPQAAESTPEKDSKDSITPLAESSSTVSLSSAQKQRFRQQGLDFIADTGVIISHKNGVQQIVWDPPVLPSLKESIKQYEAAKSANDTQVLPLCTPEFSKWLQSRHTKNDEERQPDPSRFAACRAIPDDMWLVPNHRSERHKGQSTDGYSHKHFGYEYTGSVGNEGINGAITIADPQIERKGFVATRFMVAGDVGDGIE